jgi:hypothetical protein
VVLGVLWEHTSSGSGSSVQSRRLGLARSEDRSMRVVPEKSAFTFELFALFDCGSDDLRLVWRGDGNGGHEAQ